MGFYGKSIDKHYISIFILLLFNGSTVLTYLRFRVSIIRNAHIYVYVCMCMYICIYVYSDPIRSDPILRSDPEQLFGLFPSKKKTPQKIRGQLRRSSEKRLIALSE